MPSLRHNKKRNTGLLFEFLVREMSSCLVSGDKQRYQKCINIVRKYFARGQALSKERSVFELIKKSRGMTETSAQKVLGEVKKIASALDHRKVDITKSNIIKEINYSLGKGFFDHRIADYRLLATTQLLVDSYRNSTLMIEGYTFAQLEDSLIRYMCASEPQAAMQNEEEVDSLVAELVLKKFNSKYGTVLNESQRGLLSKYVLSTMTEKFDSFTTTMEKERARIDECLSAAEHMDEFRSDPVMQNKLRESISELRNMENMCSEQSVEDMLLFQKLVEEIDSK